jgi:hypothetical protein
VDLEISKESMRCQVDVQGGRCMRGMVKGMTMYKEIVMKVEVSEVVEVVDLVVG